MSFDICGFRIQLRDAFQILALASTKRPTFPGAQEMQSSSSPFADEYRPISQRRQWAGVLVATSVGFAPYFSSCETRSEALCA